MKKQKSAGWREVLGAITDYVPRKYSGDEANYDKDLMKRLKIRPDELKLILDFLEEQGLIRYGRQEMICIDVTSRGLDVAIRSKSAASTHVIGQSSLIFSAVIALAAIVSLVLGVEDVVMKYVVSGVFAAALIYLAYLIRRM